MAEDRPARRAPAPTISRGGFLTHLRVIKLEELDTRAAEFNHLIRKAEDLDPFCSSTYWTVPAHLSFHAHRPTWLLRGEAGFVTLALGYHRRIGYMLEPLESVWGLACPFVTADPEVLVEQFLRRYLALRKRYPIWITGLRPESRLHRALEQGLQQSTTLTKAPGTCIYRARLDDGLDGFLSRRTTRFRKNLRRVQRRVAEAGVRFEAPPPPESSREALRLYERMLNVERRSWKGKEGTGILEPMMQAFYRLMILRLWPKAMLRVLFARHGERDVGFLLGARFLGSFRGLQASFDAAFARVSLGNVLHWEMIRRLCSEGCAFYDMGVDSDYKARWSEERLDTAQLIAI